MNTGRQQVEVDQIEAIYTSRFHAFLRSVSAIVGDVDLARDALHDAFAAAIRRRRTYRGDGTLEAWLWKIVLNTARNQYRARAPREQANSGLLVPEAADNGQVDEHEPVVRAAIAALSERQRLVVFLRYYADLAYGEIAEILGISRGTVGSTLNAARAELLHALEDLQEVQR
jgi:RNA polymerase sigma factor (sigma-70 family)